MKTETFNRPASYLAGLGGLAILTISQLAQAGVISAFEPPAVGGGVLQDGVQIVTDTANNDNASSANLNRVCRDDVDNVQCTSGSQRRFRKTLTEVGPFDMVFVVDNSEGTTEYRFFERADNSTDLSWTDFSLELGFGTGDDFVLSNLGDLLDFDTPDRDPTPVSNVFGTLNHLDDQLLWTDGVVADGGNATFTFAVDIPDANDNIPDGALIRDGDDTVIGYRFTLRQTPSIEVSVPEPASIFLLGLSLAAIGLIRFRRQRPG